MPPSMRALSSEQPAASQRGCWVDSGFASASQLLFQEGLTGTLTLKVKLQRLTVTECRLLLTTQCNDKLLQSPQRVDAGDWPSVASDFSSELTCEGWQRAFGITRCSVSPRARAVGGAGAPSGVCRWDRRPASPGEGSTEPGTEPRGNLQTQPAPPWKPKESE